jgi:hypothetical protein
MHNKPRKTVRKSILHDSVMVPITDPAEQAALEKRFREADKLLASRRSASVSAKPRK